MVIGFIILAIYGTIATGIAVYAVTRESSNCCDDSTRGSTGSAIMDGSNNMSGSVCSRVVCENKGTCVDVPPDNFICVCVATFYGRKCEKGMFNKFTVLILYSDLYHIQSWNKYFTVKHHNQGISSFIQWFFIGSIIHCSTNICSFSAIFCLWSKHFWIHVHWISISTGLKDTAFFAALDESRMSIGDPAVIVWKDVKYNDGNNYSPITGAYTAPIDGYVCFLLIEK